MNLGGKVIHSKRQLGLYWPWAPAPAGTSKPSPCRRVDRPCRRRRHGVATAAAVAVDTKQPLPAAPIHSGKPTRLVVLDPEPVGPDTTIDDVLPCPSIRHMLKPRPSPLTGPSWDGHFVHDDDRVVLNVLKVASAASIGGRSQHVPASLEQPDADATATAGDGNGSSSLSSSSTRSGSPSTRTDEITASGRDGRGRAPGVDAGAASSSSTDAEEGAATRVARVTTSTGLERVFVKLPPLAHRAGPRETVYFDALTVGAAVLTAGDLCPGMNDVIESIVHRLEQHGVPEGNIIGIRYGYAGFFEHRARPVVLTSRSTDGIHLKGGSILGTTKFNSSPKDTEEIVKRIERWNLNMLFVVAGEGGTQWADIIGRRCRELGLPCAVVGVPKSIDNNMQLIDKCFGHETAVEEAQRALQAAKIEASSARHGIGLVKLLGRRSGFITMSASLASGSVDVCLIPEVPFQLHGEHGLLQYVKQLVERNGEAVICVAEGAGQDLFPGQPSTAGEDEYGNPLLKDIGHLLKSELKAAVPGADIKYIDPTTMLQAVPCNSADHIYAKTAAHHAVDCAFAGYTQVTVGQVNSHFAMLPMSSCVQSFRRVDPHGRMWNRLRASTGQPNFFDEQNPPPLYGM